MASIFKKKTVCTTCNGDKVIVCCSCGEVEGECQEFECPTCHGLGYLTKFNTPVMVGACSIGFILFLAVLLIVL